MYWSSPTRGFTGAVAGSRRAKAAAHQRVVSAGVNHHHHHGDDHIVVVGDGGGCIDLHQIDTLMSGLTPDVSARGVGLGVGVGAKGTPALRQQTGLVLSDSGSVFDDGMVLHSGATAAATARGEFDGGGGGGDGLRQRCGKSGGDVLDVAQGTGKR